MSNEGIGARVLRKEDKRFITGKGKYTDDIKYENQAYAAFVRSPHAHARITKLDLTAAKAMDGVEDVLTGPELVADEIGNIICGWGRWLQRWQPDEHGRMVRTGHRKSALCWRRHRNRCGRYQSASPCSSRGCCCGI